MNWTGINWNLASINAAQIAPPWEIPLHPKDPPACTKSVTDAKLTTGCIFATAVVQVSDRLFLKGNVAATRLR